MINLVLCLLLAIVVVLCVSSILWHHRQGELCDCPGDCGHCKIRCRSNEKYYGTAARTMPVMTPQAKRRIRAESRLSRFLARIRRGVDFVCYWIFNLCAMATLLRALILGAEKLFSLWG